jgi:hypothetical protein
MAESWDIGADSPCSPSRRATDGRGSPCRCPHPPASSRPSGGCWPGRRTWTSRPRPGCRKPATRATPTPAPGCARGRGPGWSTCGRPPGRSWSSSATCWAALRWCTGSWPARWPPPPMFPRPGCTSAPPTPTGGRGSPRHRLLQPVRLPQARVRRGVGAVAGGPHRRGGRPGGRGAPAGPAGLGHHRRVGPHPQPLAGRARAQRRRRRAAHGAPAGLRVGRPPAAPAAGRRPGRRRRSRAAGGDGGVLGARHGGPHALRGLQRRPLGLPDRRARRAHRAVGPGCGPWSAPSRAHTRTWRRHCTPAWPATSRPGASAAASAPRPPGCTTTSRAS